MVLKFGHIQTTVFLAVQQLNLAQFIGLGFQITDWLKKPQSSDYVKSHAGYSIASTPPSSTVTASQGDNIHVCAVPHLLDNGCSSARESCPFPEGPQLKSALQAI